MKKIIIMSLMAMSIIAVNCARGMHSSNPYNVQSMTLAYTVRKPFLSSEIAITNRTNKPIIIESEDYSPEKRISVAPGQTVTVSRQYWGLGKDRILLIKQDNLNLGVYFSQLFGNQLAYNLVRQESGQDQISFGEKPIVLGQPAQTSAYQGMIMVPVATSTTNLKGELIVDGQHFEKSYLDLRK